MAECSYEPCPKEAAISGFCVTHYHRHNRGAPLDGTRKNAAAVCDWPQGCTAKATVRGRCQNHKRRYRVNHPGRICAFCNGPIPPEKPIDAIYCSRDCKERQARADGRSRAAVAKHYFTSRYGMTRDQALERFGDRCNICGVKDGEAGGRHGTLHVDHEHDSGRIRGVLCSECNYAIGKFKDDPALLRAAAAYLEAHHKEV